MLIGLIVVGMYSENIDEVIGECIAVLCNSMLGRLGPQRIFVAVDSEECIFPSKSAQAFSFIYSNNPFLHMIEEQYTEFQKAQGTVRSI